MAACSSPGAIIIPASPTTARLPIWWRRRSGGSSGSGNEAWAGSAATRNARPRGRLARPCLCRRNRRLLLLERAPQRGAGNDSVRSHPDPVAGHAGGGGSGRSRSVSDQLRRRRLSLFRSRPGPVWVGSTIDLYLYGNSTAAIGILVLPVLEWGALV